MAAPRTSTQIGIVAASLLVALGCGIDPDALKPAAQEKKADRIDDLEKKIDELKTLLVEMKVGKNDADVKFRALLDSQFVIGKTTLPEVERMLGKNFVSLDRPARDDIITIQYSLDEISGKKLVLDFTKPPATGIFADFMNPPNVVKDFGGRPKCPSDPVLLNFEKGLWICGFCPHILVDNDGWHLDGKMLPGAIGKERERSDAIVLPRAVARDGRVRIKLANWAPEVEHLDEARLGVVAARPDEELDLDVRGTGWLWRTERVLRDAAIATADGSDSWRWDLGGTSLPPQTVLVLELRNTEQFREHAEASYRRGVEPNADLRIASGDSGSIPPVGTKLFRRIVVPVSPEAAEFVLQAPAKMWWVRRAWIGSGRPAPMRWIAPSENASLAARDGQRLRLGPQEEAEVDFRLPAEFEGADKPAFALRLFGWYEFLP